MQTSKPDSAPSKRPYRRRQQTLDVNAETMDAGDTPSETVPLLRDWCAWAQERGHQAAAADLIARSRAILHEAESQ